MKVPYGLNDNNLEFVGYFSDKTIDLFHETLDTGFGASLQQRRYCQRCNTAIRVSDQLLQIHIARRNGRWMIDRNLKCKVIGKELKKTQTFDNVLTAAKR
jgi:hypothetical protein